MMSLPTRFKLVFFAPTTSTRPILDHVFTRFPKEAGKIGEYERCAFVSHGTGQFTSGAEANPAIGERGQAQFVEEDRVEFIVNDQGDRSTLKSVVEVLKKAHPYEEVAIDMFKLEDI